MLDEQIITAVATGNLKAISEQPALLSNLAYSNAVSSNNLGQQNAVSNQQAGNQLGVPLVAKAVNAISNIDPLASRSAVNVLTNNELAQTIADLKASVEAFTASGGDPERLVLGDLELTISRDGKLVVVALKGPVPDIFIPGKFTREEVDVVIDSSRGITVTMKKL